MANYFKSIRYFLYAIIFILLYYRIMATAVLMLFVDTSVMGNVIAHVILATKEMVLSVQGVSVELVSFKIHFRLNIMIYQT